VGLLQEVDSDVAFDAAVDALLSTDAQLVSSVVVGDKGVDLSKAAGLVAVLSRPGFPFGHLCVEARSPLSDLLEHAFRSVLESLGTMQALLGLQAVAVPGEAPVTAEFSEYVLGGLSFLAVFSEVGGGALNIPLERREFVEERARRSVDDRSKAKALRPELADGVGCWSRA
jgi:hypothetical protein